jgi:Bacteriocin-protection, YdeI or OmpD-Associated
MPTNPTTTPPTKKPDGFLHEMPPDLQDAIDAVVGLQAKWDKLTPLAQNEWICWVTIVKKPETRPEHITRLKEDLLNGKKRPCCWPGCPHRRPSAAKYFTKKPKLTQN